MTFLRFQTFNEALFFSERSKEIAEITPKRVTQGNNFQNEAKYAAVQAIDNDLRTGAVTETKDGACWLKLQFGETQFIHKIVIYSPFYTNWYFSDDKCVTNEEEFKNCVDEANNVDVSVYLRGAMQKSCGTLQLTYGREQSDQIYTLLCNTRGDTVQLKKNTGTITLFEIVVTSSGKLISL